jgi:hypothetical protein
MEIHAPVPLLPVLSGQSNRIPVFDALTIWDMRGHLQTVYDLGTLVTDASGD